MKQELESEIEMLSLIPFGDKKCRALVKTLIKHRNNLFRFMVEDVESHNNAAERGLRPSVVMRKITGGNRSHKGAKSHEVIMSVMETWKKQSMDFFEHGYHYIQKGLR